MQNHRLKTKSPSLIAGLGSVLLFIAIPHHLQEIFAIRNLVAPVIALTLDGLPALGLIYAGYRVANANFSSADQWHVWLWCLAGATLFMAVMGTSILVRAIEGRIIGEAIFPLLIATGVGGNAGAVAGYQTVRARVEARRAQSATDTLRERTQQLESISERLEELSFDITTDQVAESIVMIAKDALGHPHVTLLQYDSDNNELLPWKTTDSVLEETNAEDIDSLPAVPSGTEYMSVFNSSKVRKITDYSSVEQSVLAEGSIQQCLFVPIDEFGLLIVGATSNKELDSTDGDLLSILARNAEAAFERAEREQSLETYKNQLEKSNENLQEFAYIASHDLQEPLRSVTSYLDLIETEYGDKLDEDGQFYIERAGNNASRMSSMIDALLQYSRVKSQGGEFISVDSSEIVSETIDSLGILVQETEAEIEYESLPTVTADKDQLRQVFQNLIKNAIEHGGTPPYIEIQGEDRGTEWQFSVSDDGPGIPEAQQDRIFEIFQQATDDEDESGESGIGLAICERIVARHRGDIWVESDGDGSTFKFTIDKATN